MKIEEYKKVNNQKEIKELQYKTNGFHDSLIKEIHIVNSAFVDKKKVMNSDFGYNARLLIQSQFNPIGTELVLIDIRKIHFEKLPEIFGGSIKAIVENEELFQLNFDTEFKLVCREIYYKTDNDFYGNRIFLNGQVPNNEMTFSINLGDNWRQCEECSEAWEIDEKIEVDSCPNCNCLTQLR